MRERGEVVAVRGGIAVVRMKRSEACAGCRGCAALAGGEREMEAFNAIGAAAGDRVEGEGSGARYTEAAFLVFIVPLIAALAGYAAGAAVSGSERTAVLCGAAALIPAFAILRACDRWVGKTGALRPRIVRMYAEDGGCHGQIG